LRGAKGPRPFASSIPEYGDRAMRTKALTIALFGGLLAAAAANAQQNTPAQSPDATPPTPEQRATTEPIAPVTANSASTDTNKPAEQMKLAKIAKFNTLDANKDGFLSKAEVGSDMPVSDNFAKYDLNGDNKISRSEFENTQF
jgi:hypothetical protein